MRMDLAASLILEHPRSRTQVAAQVRRLKSEVIPNETLCRATQRAACRIRIESPSRFAKPPHLLQTLWDANPAIRKSGYLADSEVAPFQPPTYLCTSRPPNAQAQQPRQPQELTALAKQRRLPRSAGAHC